MNGAAAKASAREIRRAFGHQAVDQIQNLITAATHHTQVLQQHTDELVAQAKSLREAKQHTADVYHALCDFRHRTFIERWRWLVLGR